MIWLQTLIIQKMITTSLKILLNVNLFLQQKFLAKTCHIMIPKGRVFYKDSKKYLFDILGFFLQTAMNFQSLLQIE